MAQIDDRPAYFWEGDVLLAPRVGGGYRRVAHADEFPQLRRLRILREGQEARRRERDRERYGY